MHDCIRADQRWVAYPDQDFTYGAGITEFDQAPVVVHVSGFGDRSGSARPALLSVLADECDSNFVKPEVAIICSKTHSTARQRRRIDRSLIRDCFLAAVMSRGDLSESEWRVLKDLLLIEAINRGRRRRLEQNRAIAIINRIPWRLRCGTPWPDFSPVNLTVWLMPEADPLSSTQRLARQQIARPMTR